MQLIKPLSSRQRAWLLLAGAAAALGGAGPAVASSDTSPPPGGVYPLKPGIYVIQDTGCTDPANAAIRLYDGKGISSAHTHACRAVVRARAGNTFTVDQTCIDAGAGAAPRFKERQAITVSDALTFSQRIGGHDTTYRYCPANQLPAGLTGAAR